MIDLRRRPLAHTLLSILEWGLTGIAKRTMPEYRPRTYHNRVLRAYLAAFSGDVVNVSGWEDKDKEGGFYQDYFGTTRRYAVTNIHGDRGMPPAMRPGVESIYLNLEEKITKDLHGAFDVVFSHTVLEHVYDVQMALNNIADMSRDIVVSVVPFSQSVHYTRTYGDYVRLSAFFLKRFFEDRGFTVLLSTTNDQAFFPIYLTMIVSRHPGRHSESFHLAPLSYDIQITPGRYGRYGIAGLNLPPD